MMDYGLNPDEARELQAQLDAGEWDALLQVQRQLSDAPMLAPSAGFTNRVLTELAVRERRQARRRNVIGAIAFAFGTLVVTALVIWASPLDLLVQARGVGTLFNTLLSLANSLSTLFFIGRTFGEVLLHDTGSTGLLLFALFAFALTLVWARVVAGTAPLNRPDLA